MTYGFIENENCIAAVLKFNDLQKIIITGNKATPLTVSSQYIPHHSSSIISEFNIHKHALFAFSAASLKIARKCKSHVT